jgi:Fe-S-cluster-containing hydrogenase component 2
MIKRMKITVNPKKCPQNHKCPSIAICPKSAISQSDIYALPVVDTNRFVNCGLCMKYCPKGAFEKVETE